MFEKLFCKHKFTITRQTNVWFYDEIFGYSDGKYYYDEIAYRVSIVCNECGKVKNLTSKTTKINWHTDKHYNMLNDTEKKSFEAKKLLLAKKIEKKYKLTLINI